MKLALVLIVIGAVLMIDGVVRVIVGLIFSTPTLVFGGFLTGLLLGGLLLSFGFRRLGRRKLKRIQEQEPSE